MCSTVQEQITTCGQNAIVKIGERTNIRPQKTTNSNSRHKSCFLDIIFGSWRAEPNQIMPNILNILVILTEFW